MVYKITNLVNGKAYFGKTNNLNRRKNEHLSEATRQRRTTHLYHSIRKYGVDSFSFEVLFSFTSESQAYRKEIELIQAAGTTNPAVGYNQTLGGDGVRVTAEGRKRLSALGKSRTGSKNPFFGCTHSEASRSKIRESRKRYAGPKHPMWGKRHSDETKRRMSETKSGKEIWSPEQRVEIGQRSAGEKSSTAKITNAQAASLRDQFASGVSAKELQVIYGLSKASVWRVIRRETFREI